MALLVPEGQRRRPGVLVETLSAHYTSPGRGPGSICHSAENIGTEGICGCRRNSEVTVSA